MRAGDQVPTPVAERLDLEGFVLCEQPPQLRRETCALLKRQPADQRRLAAIENAAQRRERLEAVAREPERVRPPILRVALSHDEPLLLERVDELADRRAVAMHELAELGLRHAPERPEQRHRG